MHELGACVTSTSTSLQYLTDEHWVKPVVCRECPHSGKDGLFLIQLPTIDILDP